MAHFTFEERLVLYRLNKAKRSKSEIAIALGLYWFSVKRSFGSLRLAGQETTVKDISYSLRISGAAAPRLFSERSRRPGVLIAAPGPRLAFLWVPFRGVHTRSESE